VMVCNNKCDNYKAKRPVGGQRYNDGQKRCTLCQAWIRWDGKFCPCCNFLLRCNPRRKQMKLLLEPIEVRSR